MVPAKLASEETGPDRLGAGGTGTASVGATPWIFASEPLPLTARE
jgi:hypothetical protein